MSASGGVAPPAVSQLGTEHLSFHQLAELHNQTWSDSLEEWHSMSVEEQRAMLSQVKEAKRASMPRPPLPRVPPMKNSAHMLGELDEDPSPPLPGKKKPRAARVKERPHAVASASASSTLHAAAQTNDVRELKRLLKGDSVDVNIGGIFGQTPLHLAALRDAVGAINLLLDAGADVNKVDDDKATALHRAAQEGNVDAISVLLKAGADIEKLHKKRHSTAIGIALASGRTAAVKKLLEHGAMLPPTALHTAAKMRDTETVPLLLLHKANPNAEDNEGATALHFAASNNGVAVAMLLLNAGADPNRVRKNEGKQALWTPLHCAANHKHEEMVLLLLSRGAQATAKAGDSTTAKDLALQKGAQRIADVLRDAEAGILPAIECTTLPRNASRQGGGMKRPISAPPKAIVAAKPTAPPANGQSGAKSDVEKENTAVAMDLDDVFGPPSPAAYTGASDDLTIQKCDKCGLPTKRKHNERGHFINGMHKICTCASSKRFKPTELIPVLDRSGKPISPYPVALSTDVVIGGKDIAPHAGKLAEYLVTHGKGNHRDAIRIHSNNSPQSGVSLKLPSTLPIFKIPIEVELSKKGNSFTLRDAELIPYLHELAALMRMRGSEESVVERMYAHYEAMVSATASRQPPAAALAHHLRKPPGAPEKPEPQSRTGSVVINLVDSD